MLSYLFQIFLREIESVEQSQVKPFHLRNSRICKNRIGGFILRHRNSEIYKAIIFTYSRRKKYEPWKFCYRLLQQVEKSPSFTITNSQTQFGCASLTQNSQSNVDVKTIKPVE